MVYDCIKAFDVWTIDDNGHRVEIKGEQVQKGSMWKLDESKATLTDADLQLTDVTGLRWIEISNKRLASHFKEIKS